MRWLLAIGLSLTLAGSAAANVAEQGDPILGDFGPPADDARCKTCDGLKLLQLGQYARALDVFQRLAAKHVPAAMVQVGWIYELGLGVSVDYDQARRSFTRAAQAGDAGGMAGLGLMLQHGQGGPVDLAGAMALYRQAIAKGPDPLAMNQIGYMTEHGLGVAADPKAAWCWYEWAHVNGQASADKHLVAMAAAGMTPPTECSVLNR
jgi:TPR repeat protein